MTPYRLESTRSDGSPQPEAAYLPRYLPTVLASLSRWEETSGEQGEVIVVDNASTDATAHMAATSSTA
ncbi:MULTISPECIES: hypothetical protein [unclassified Streptomyces]|uniref:hypothetical protein n=1 Tax=unclassified Streptomyces TaxID=2593676 RepID=UPI00224CC553|nr:MULTISPECIES: hypothetical protein [unclassified Streptomyces]MCX5049794.1 hypothetical protein [Streptomyces sp. NBC_00474]